MPTPSRIARKARALLPRRGVALRGRLRTRSVLLETVATAALYVVAGAGPFEGRTERFDDCLHVETRFTLLRGQQPLRETIGSDWYCAEVGLVQSEELDASTGVATRSVLVGRDGGAEDTTLLPSATVLASLADRSTRPSSEAPPASSSPGATLPNADADLSQPLAWTLTRVGRARVTADAGESTIPPVWVPDDPPLLLVAGYAGDLIALDAGDELGTIRWRFRPAGTVFSPPAYDPANGRIYFGAGDRRLYALDIRGLFLWSFQTGDNVATRPLAPPLHRNGEGVGGGASLVIFGSEDGTVYALDADSGRERWHASAGGPVVSAPVLADDGTVVAIGSDDGTVFGLNAATGEERWQYTAGGAIEAPLVADDAGMLYVASRDGTLAAVDPSDCEETCEARWETKICVLFRPTAASSSTRRSSTRGWPSSSTRAATSTCSIPRPAWAPAS